MSKHTPGPWKCVDTSYHAHDYRLLRPDDSAMPVNAPCNDHSEQRANAALIAAAPDLLEACRALVVAFDGEVDCTDILDMIGNKDSALRAAIARAEGRA